MALRPIQYLQQPKQFDLQQGLQIGGAIQGIRARSAAEEKAVLAKQDADAIKKQYSIDLQEAFKSKSPQAFAMLTAKYPQLREAFKQSYSIISEEQKKNEIAIQGQVYNALNTGNQDVALKLVDERIVAIKNIDGDTSTLDKIRESIVKDPELAKGSLMFSLSNSMEPDKFAKYIETRGKVELQPGDVKKQKAEFTKYAKDLNLKDAQIAKIKAETKKLGFESQKAIMELKSKEGKEGFITDPKDLMKAEQGLRKEWTSRTSDLNSANQNYTKIEIAAKDKTGPGDIALITSFMKMLDPGSVVRETEFATAQNTAGLFDTLTNHLTKLQDGTLLGLDDKARQKFVTLSKKYRDAAEEETKSIRKTFENNIKTYGMRPENIFSDDVQEEVTVQKTKAIESIQIGSIVTQGGKRYRKTESGFEEVQ